MSCRCSDLDECWELRRHAEAFLQLHPTLLTLNHRVGDAIKRAAVLQFCLLSAATVAVDTGLLARHRTEGWDVCKKMPVVQPEKLVKLQQAGDTIRNVSTASI